MALALALLSRSRREALLVSYAVFAGLCGLRLAASTSWASRVLGFDPRLLDYVEAFVSYWITAPAVLFFTRDPAPSEGPDELRQFVKERLPLLFDTTDPKKVH